MAQTDNLKSGTIRPLALAKGEVHLWLVDLDEQLAFQHDHYRLLQQDERAKADRMATRTLFARQVAAHGCLRLLLADYLGVAAASIGFTSGTNGKPRLNPALQNQLSFNLSHSEGIAIIGITNGAEIGVDIERVRPMPDRLPIARDFFTPSEFEQLVDMTEADSALAFLRCWTLKEAYVKATGEGLSMPLNSFEVSMDPGSPPRLLQTASGTPAEWSLHSFLPRAGYLAGVAVCGPVTDWACNVLRR